MNLAARFLPKLLASCLAVIGLHGPALAQQPAGPDANLLKNAKFATGTEDWKFHTSSAGTFARDASERHEGNPSVRIDHIIPADTYVNQEVILKPATRYRLSGWIKAKSVAKAPGQRDGSAGASLSVLGGYDKTQDVTEAKDWVHVSVDFSTRTKTDVMVGPRLGHYGKLVTGSAWFADITLVELGPGAGVAQQPVASPPTGPVSRVNTSSPTASELVKTQRNNLVFVSGDDGSGSGFLAKYGNRTFLFTNAHVAAGVHKAGFQTLQGEKVQIGGASVAVGHDIFLMQAAAKGEPLEIMTGVDENTSIGDDIVVLGNAEGAGVINTITGKIVGVGPNLIEVDAEFKPGNSGSPIIHLKSGKVIGAATYLIIRKFDSATNQPVKDPIVRRFGYRIDSVKAWQPVQWPAFFAQAKDLENIETLTDDLAAFLDDLAKDSKVDRTLHMNPVIKTRIDSWLASKLRGLSLRDRQSADQNFISFLKVTCQSDLAAARPRLTYDYFQRALDDQQKQRAQIADIFDKIIKDIGR